MTASVLRRYAAVKRVAAGAVSGPVAAMALALCLAPFATPLQPAQASEAMTRSTSYIDDRSSAKRVIESYYNAINLKQYARAYSYFGEGDATAPYDRWARGYADTEWVTVAVGHVTPDFGAGQQNYDVPVALQSLSTDGQTTVYRGCYLVGMPDPSMVDPPKHIPLSIIVGHLERSDEPLSRAVPASCEGGRPS